MKGVEQDEIFKNISSSYFDFNNLYVMRMPKQK